MKTYIATSPITHEIMGTVTQDLVVKYAVTYFHPLNKKWVSPYFRPTKEGAEREFVHLTEIMLGDRKAQKWTPAQFKEAKKSLQIYKVDGVELPKEILKTILPAVADRQMEAPAPAPEMPAKVVRATDTVKVPVKPVEKAKVPELVKAKTGRFSCKDSNISNTPKADIPAEPAKTSEVPAPVVPKFKPRPAPPRKRAPKTAVQK